MFLQGNLSSQWRFLSSPESRTADKLIDERLRDPYTSIEAVVVTADSTPYSDDSFADFIDVLIQDIRALGTDVGGFAAGDLTIFQQMGFGLAVAVLLDATIVRSILVPATMRLLGRRNWYLPGWLNWMPDLNIEGDAEGEE